MPFCVRVSSLRNTQINMRILGVSLQTLLLFLIVYVGISSAKRPKRQIIFEDDDNTNSLLNSNCQTPDRRPGRCIRLADCMALVQSVSRNVLRRYVCGFEEDEPSVCCPLSREEIGTTARPTPRLVRFTPSLTVMTTTRTEVTTTFEPVEDPRNVTGGVTQIPQLDSLTKPPFLPESCGVSLSTVNRDMGESRVKLGDWPWMAEIYVRSNDVLVPNCGGALVTNQHVVTAAHCVVSGRRSIAIDPSRVVVRLGAHNLTVRNEPGSVDVEVEAIRRHDQFESRTLKNDIAVLKLRTPVYFSRTISPVCLPYDSLTRVENITDRIVIVTGYGTTPFNGNSSNVLMQAVYVAESQEVCRRSYEPEVQISNVYMCASLMDDFKDVCQVGDSGEPLVAFGNSSYYLVGIVSFGRQCGQPNYPILFTRVSEFLDWLTRNLSD